MPLEEFAFATLKVVVPGAVMTIPVGAVFNVTARVAVPAGAVTGLTLTTWPAEGPVIALQFTVMALGFKVSDVACRVPVKIANASSENTMFDRLSLNFDLFIGSSLWVSNGILP